MAPTIFRIGYNKKRSLCTSSYTVEPLWSGHHWDLAWVMFMLSFVYPASRLWICLSSLLLVAKEMGIHNSLLHIVANEVGICDTGVVALTVYVSWPYLQFLVFLIWMFHKGIHWLPILLRIQNFILYRFEIKYEPVESSSGCGTNENTSGWLLGWEQYSHALATFFWFESSSDV